jgi:hypothetical protein
MSLSSFAMSLRYYEGDSPISFASSPPAPRVEGSLRLISQALNTNHTTQNQRYRTILAPVLPGETKLTLVDSEMTLPNNVPVYALLVVVVAMLALSKAILASSFDPLRKVPGPMLASFSYLYELWCTTILDDWGRTLKGLHYQHGILPSLSMPSRQINLLTSPRTSRPNWPKRSPSLRPRIHYQAFQ